MAMLKPEENHNSQFLPIEIMEEILIRCPVKSLLRFLSVSKLLHSIITNPNFISKKQNYILKNAVKPYPNWQKSLEDSGFSDAWKKDILRSGVEELRVEYETDVASGTSHPVGSLRNNIHVIGASKGLVCFCSCTAWYPPETRFPRFFVALFLWNPTMRKYVKIPPPMHISMVCHDPESYNYNRLIVVKFLYDEKDEDYKVFLMEDTHLMQTKVEVFELKKNAWRVIDGADSSIRGWSVNNFVFQDEAMHFMSRVGEGFGYGYRVGSDSIQLIVVYLSRRSVTKTILPEDLESAFNPLDYRRYACFPEDYVESLALVNSFK